jgi:hypothetical protein
LVIDSDQKSFWGLLLGSAKFDRQYCNRRELSAP